MNVRYKTYMLVTLAAALGALGASPVAAQVGDTTRAARDSVTRAQAPRRYQVHKEQGAAAGAYGAGRTDTTVSAGALATPTVTDTAAGAVSGNMGGNMGARTDSTGMMRTDSTGMMRMDSSGMMRTDSAGMMQMDSAGMMRTDSTGMMPPDSGMMRMDSTAMPTDTAGMMPADSTGAMRMDSTAGMPMGNAGIPAADSTGAVHTDSTGVMAGGAMAGAAADTVPGIYDTGMQPRRFANGFYIGVGGGATMPMGRFSDFYKTGWNISVPFGWRSLSGFPLGMQAEVSYNQLQGQTITSGVTYTAADPKIWSGLLDLTLNVPLGSDRVGLYLMGGGGVHRFTDFAQASTDGGGTSTTKFGVNGGAGLTFGIGAVNLFLESRYVSVFTDGPNTNYVPIVLGVSLF